MCCDSLSVNNEHLCSVTLRPFVEGKNVLNSVRVAEGRSSEANRKDPRLIIQPSRIDWHRWYREFKYLEIICRQLSEQRCVCCWVKRIREWIKMCVLLVSGEVPLLHSSTYIPREKIVESSFFVPYFQASTSTFVCKWKCLSEFPKKSSF